MMKTVGVSQGRKLYRKLYQAVRFVGPRFRMSNLKTAALAWEKPEDYIAVHWSKSTNFGDAASPVVVACISGRRPLNANSTFLRSDTPVYSVVGSVLQFSARKNLEVWGSGFITADHRFARRPATIYAVRGPLTRNKCLSEGLDCPEIYGDPAVFIFDAFRDEYVEKKWRVGFIPHYADQTNSCWNGLIGSPDAKFIDVNDPIGDVIRQAKACDVLVSSSLHGLIMADCLGIPSVWVGASTLVVKDGFKFHDYFLSVGKMWEPVVISAGDNTEALARLAKLEGTPFSRERLLEVCPFRCAAVTSVQDISRSVRKRLAATSKSS